MLYKNKILRKIEEKGRGNTNIDKVMKEVAEELDKMIPDPKKEDYVFTNLRSGRARCQIYETGCGLSINPDTHKEEYKKVLTDSGSYPEILLGPGGFIDFILAGRRIELNDGFTHDDCYVRVGVFTLDNDKGILVGGTHAFVFSVLVLRLPPYYQIKSLSDIRGRVSSSCGRGPSWATFFVIDDYNKLEEAAECLSQNPYGLRKLVSILVSWPNHLSIGSDDPVYFKPDLFPVMDDFCLYRQDKKGDIYSKKIKTPPYISLYEKAWERNLKDITRETVEEMIQKDFIFRLLYRSGFI